MNFRRLSRTLCAPGILLLIGSLMLIPSRPTKAQLATSFYNITGIQTRTLPNAVQITIQTDGSVRYGSDQNDFYQFTQGNFSQKTLTTLHLRLLGARARLPAFTDIGVYPVDSAIVSLGQSKFISPFYSNGASEANALKVDIDINFFVPVRVQRFLLSSQQYDGLYFSDTLGPRDVEVKVGPDNSSIIITVITDRTDVMGGSRMHRSPTELLHHSLSVTPVSTATPPTATPSSGLLRIAVLHTPLAEVLTAVSVAADLPLSIQTTAAETDISLFLPETTPEQFLQTLATSYGLQVTPRTVEEGGGFMIGRGGAGALTERIPLHYLSPATARLLFPDFLLPLLRADSEHNALVVAGSPELIAHLHQDIQKLDLPRPQVRVEATIWELSSTKDINAALSGIRTVGRDSETIDTDAGQISVLIEKSQVNLISVALQALASQGRAKLAARPFVVAASGAQGTLFLGQQRYIIVLQQQFGQQIAQALQVQIGYTLKVTPTIGANDDITLSLSPSISTVDSIEAKTGLPTVGIRQFTSVIRLRPNQEIILAGLNNDLQSRTTNRLSPLARIPFIGTLFAGRHKSHTQTALLLFVTATKV